MSQHRLYYIDNLRIFLIALVVLHHFSITYGAPGGWYYSESQAGIPEVIPMAMFVATNQSFFMGLFFFVSAFFIVPSIERKGTKKFIKDRLIRLGIPTLIFFFILNPLTNFIANHFIRGQEAGFLEHIYPGKSFGFGPTWFIEALLLFTLVYLLLRLRPKKFTLAFPGNATILALAFFTGVAQFVIRLWLHVGWSWGITNFQFPHFVQYILLFSFGIVAWQNNWIDQLAPKHARRWFVFAQLLIFIGFPALFVLGKAPSLGTDPFMGGPTLQSFFYAIWEQLLGFSLIIGLIGIFRSRFHSQGRFAKNLSESAYAVYIFHAPLLVALSAFFVHLSVPQILKFLILSPLALLLTFGFAWLIKQLPVLKRIF